MVVELLEDKKLWDQFVETSPQGLLFHKWDFLKTVERHSKYRLLPYAIYSGDELRCIFPFFIWRDRFGLTHMGSPAPFDTQILYLGPAFDPSLQALWAHKQEKILEQVTDELCREIDTIAPNFFGFVTAPNFLDVRTFIWKNYRAHLRFTYAIDLEKSLDEIWASFCKNCRWEIKKLSKYSPEVKQTHDVSAFLDIWRPRFSELGVEVPLLGDSYLKELVATFPQEVSVDNLIVDGKLATAAVNCVLQKDRYCAWIGGVSARKDLGVNDYLTWELVKRAKSEGFKKLDLSEPDARLSPYKAKFGPVLEPFCFVERTNTKGKPVYFAYQMLSWAKKLVLGALQRADR